MLVKLWMIIHNDPGRSQRLTATITFKLKRQLIKHLELALANSKQPSKALQRLLFQLHINRFFNRCLSCPDCRRWLKVETDPGVQPLPI